MTTPKYQASGKSVEIKFLHNNIPLTYDPFLDMVYVDDTNVSVDLTDEFSSTTPLYGRPLFESLLLVLEDMVCDIECADDPQSPVELPDDLVTAYTRIYWSVLHYRTEDAEAAYKLSPTAENFRSLRRLQLDLRAWGDSYEACAI